MAGSGGQAVRRVGIEFSARGNLPRTLLDLCQKLREADRLTAKWKAAFSQFEATSLRNTSRIAANVGRISQALQSGARINVAAARTDTSRVALAARRNAEEQRHILLARMQGAATADVLRKTRQRLDEQARIQRVINSLKAAETGYTLKTVLAETKANLQRQRAHQLQVRQTADAQRLLHLAQRIRAALPGSGNLIGGSLGVAGWGLAPARSLVNLAYQPQHGATPAQKFHHYLRERAGIEQMKLGPEGTSQALTAAEQVRQKVRGLDMADAIDVIKDLINITGSVKDATHGPLPALLAKFRVTNRAAYGLTAYEGYSAIRAAEMLTPQQKGMTGEEREHAVGSRLELINKVMGGSGGKIRPGEILQFAKTAQAAKFSLSEKGIYHLAPIIQEMGGMRTGTSLVSVMQNLANGRMTHASAQNMLALGLLDRSKVEYDKVGRVKRVMPGSTVDSDLLREDPVAWVDKHLLPKLEGKKQAQQDELINSILSNRTAAGLVATIVAQNARIHKDTGLYLGAKGIDESNAAQRDYFLRAETDYQKALDTLRQKTAVVILPSLTRGLNNLTGLLEWLNKTIEANPLLAKIGTAGIFGGGALVASAGTLVAIVGTIRTIGALGGAARVLGLVAVELAAINAQGGLRPGIPLGGGAGAAGAAGAGAAGGAAAARGRTAVGVGARLAGLGALANTPAAAAGAGPIALTIGTGAAIGVGGGMAIQGHLERTGAADAIQSMLAGALPTGAGLTPAQQRQMEERLMRKNLGRTARQLATGNLTINVHGPIQTTGPDAQGLVKDLVRAAARSGSVPRSGRISNFAYPQ